MRSRNHSEIHYPAITGIFHNNTSISTHVLIIVTFNKKSNYYFLEVQVRFELTVLRVCNPLPWTTRPLHHILAEGVGIEPTQLLITTVHLSRVLHYRPAHLPAYSYYIPNAVSNPHKGQHKVLFAYEMLNFE